MPRTTGINKLEVNNGWSYKTDKQDLLTGSFWKRPCRPLKLEEILKTFDSAHLGGKMEGGDQFPADNIPHVWLNVYAKLDPKDKLAFCGASSVWHNWVEPKRTESLLSEVKPQLAEALPWSKFLRPRELCQAWKEEIDHQNQTYRSNLSLYYEIASDEGRPCSRSRPCKNFFHLAKDVEEFMKEMRTHPGNPFPGRSIGLNCYFNHPREHEDFNEELRDYWRTITLLLEKFGSHVHFAQICIHDGVEDELWAANGLGTLEGQTYLREFLLRLPNLKLVHIFGEYGSPFMEDEIREFYRVNPLPRLEHLETVELSHTSLATVDEALSSCCVPANIKRLSVYRNGQEHPEHLRHFDAVYGFKNLEVLFAPILFHQLETLASLERRPPLREVYLSFEDAPYLDDVFRILEVFGETLIQFRSSSRMRLRNDVENGEPFSCNLPHLKKIFFAEYWGTADLLFQFKSLTHVKIWRLRDDTYWQFPGFKERLEDASIWILMPSLQWLSLGNRATVYERNVMEQPRAVSEQRMEVLEEPREVLEKPRLDCIDNHETTGLQGRTWSQECRLVLMEVLSAVLTDFFHGLLF